MYETIVIGGGIAGLYIALHLDNALVLEADGRLGGRIFTHQTPKYEIGAGRIDTRHTLVRKLLKQFQLTEIHLPQLQTDIALLRTLPLSESDRLRDRTLGDICRARFGAEVTERLRQTFGYYSEFEVMNAYDAVALLRVLATQSPQTSFWTFLKCPF